VVATSNGRGANPIFDQQQLVMDQVPPARYLVRPDRFYLSFGKISQGGSTPMKSFIRVSSTSTAIKMLLVCLFAGVAILFPIFVQHTMAATGASVSVNANSSLGKIPAPAYGINQAAWDGLLLDPTLPGLLSATGAGIMRYPGGSLSDGYHWQSNTTETSYANPSNTFDAFMHLAQQAGTQPMITVDYGAGTPQEAAGWVQYANKGGSSYNGPVPTYSGGSSTGHTYGIKYWEIGNEVYGDGTYGTSWELDHNTLGPTTYANRVVAYSQAMKAVDPSIKVGLVVTTPGNWPDGITSSSSPQPWNDTVLPLACSAADFVIVHWYPNAGGTPEANVLASTNQIPAMVSAIRSKINQYCGSRASSIQIMVTETNGGPIDPGQRATSWFDGLFLADTYMTMLENGVANIDWWETHDDLLSSASCTGSSCEPPAETPFPPYYALQMLTTHLGQVGDTMVSSSSSQSLVAVHAVKQANGKLAVLLVNKDPNNSYTVSLGLTGYTASAATTVYAYGTNGSGITSTSGSSSSVTIAPYSLTTVVFSPKTGVTPTPTPVQGTTPTPTPTQGITPTPVSGASCSVHYAITNQWQGGFGVSLAITNTGTTPINGWSLQFSFPNGQTITQLWNGSYTQSSSAVTITNVSYNGTIPAGGTLNSPPGFNGTWNGLNTVPTSFALNGKTCTTL
jgi:hypothetical protein